LVRFFAVGVGLALLAAGTGGTPAATSSPPPTNAAKVFRWGNAQWHDGFVGPLRSTWAVNRKKQVRNQNGMLTLNGTRTSGTVTARLSGHVRQYGRWEARVRGRQYGTGATPYRVVWELVPASGRYHCGARSIVLGEYALGTNRAAMHLRNLPARDYTTSKALTLTGDRFHTYAVEVTRDHISWFVDTKVIRTERRSGARTGAKYSVRFRLAAPRGARMNPGRMQMDWVRYYTLERPNARSIKAPAARLVRYAGAC
jgi:hypothetical protein